MGKQLNDEHRRDIDLTVNAARVAAGTRSYRFRLGQILRWLRRQVDEPPAGEPLHSPQADTLQPIPAGRVIELRNRDSEHPLAPGNGRRTAT